MIYCLKRLDHIQDYIYEKILDLLGELDFYWDNTILCDGETIELWNPNTALFIDTKRKVVFQTRIISNSIIEINETFFERIKIYYEHLMWCSENTIAKKVFLGELGKTNPLESSFLSESLKS